MGFYGNITNTSNTTFSFDRIYPNRLAMDANANNDGVFIGRYVLVEYQEEAAYPVAYHATETSEDSGQYYFYSSTNQEEISKIKYLGLPPGEPDHLPSVDDVNAIYQDGFYKGEILQRYIYSSDKKDWIFSEEFYACVGEDDKHFAVFELITNPSMKSHYIQNFEIDEKHYGQESKGFKGYDSTVWMKSSVTASDGKLITKYVNIADLNSVVPTFDIAADAPTMEPLTPHFDADSTNVYYKLHAQAPYGFRVKKQENELFSDEKTKHYTVQYHKDTGVTTSTPTQVGADIYYNKEAFRAKPEKDEDGNIIPVVKKDTATVNEIKLQPSGYSENYDNKYSHKTTGDLDLVGDIQEFSLRLPAIGNMMSDAWDIIHGPNRDDAQTDDNSSLQGRLDSFKAMEKDAIPMKRNSDGTFVGSRINGNSNRAVGTNKILEENLSTSFDQDDAWIRTEIDTMGLDNTNKLSGISIHHTFHEDKTNYDFLTNKNVDGIESENESDKIKLYTPKVDAAGHVVGKSIETVTLPYGYKTIKVTNTGDDAILNAAQVVNPDGQIADNTQDELTLSASNRWIKLDNNSEDTIKFGHQVNPIEEKDKDLTDLNDGTDTITIQDTIYDEAGHVTANQKHTYTLPYSFKYINVANDGKEKIASPVSTAGTQIADNTQDTLKLTTSNKWILLDGGSEDTVQFGHLLKTVPTTTSTQSLSDEISQAVTFKVYNDSFDEAGHHNGRDTKTITMPFGYGKIKGDSGDTAATATYDEFSVLSGDDWIKTEATKDTITITHTGPVATDAKNDSNKTPNFGETFTIEDWVFDNKGHKANLSTHTVKIPKGSLNDLIATSSSVLTGISMIPETGVITQSHNDVGKLALVGYTTSNDRTDIGSGDTINSAFAKLQNQISYEESRINTILNGTDDLTDTLDTFIELQTYIAEHGEEAADMAKAINDEANRAKAAESDLSTKLTNEITRAQTAENNLNIRINNLGTAANKNVEYFALAGSYDDRVTSEEYEAKIQELQNTISNLEARIATLEDLSIEATLASLEARIAALEPEPGPEVTVEGE